MRCIGTLEFIDDFQRNCHVTQRRLIEAKQTIKKCPEKKESLTPASKDDVESDKENASPNIRVGVKRKRQSTNVEKSKVAKPMPLGPKSLNIDESDRVRVDKEDIKSDAKKAIQIPAEPLKANTKPIPSVTKAKCDSSTKTECSERAEDEAPCEEVSTERRTRSRASSRNSLVITRPQSESNAPLDSPKSKPVPVIVKLEKPDNLEAAAAVTSLKNGDVAKSNKLVWIPSAAMLPEGDKPRSTRVEKRHDECPTAGDEAEERIEKTPEMSSTRAASEEQVGTMEGVRKSVIKTTTQAVKTMEQSDTPRGRETRRSLSIAKRNKAVVDEKAAEEEDEESSENRRKFGKISDLISREQKEAIERYYTVDMSAVDEEVVGEKILFLEKKMFGCKICKASYPRQDKCQVHIWGHLDMKPYKCKACDFATVTVSNIRCHIRKSHLKIKPYACEHCEKRYVTAFLLEEHMNTHTGSRPYSCTVCEFTSASRQVLSYHNATHKPVKDITCDVCGKEFYSKARMRAHMVIHNKDKAANMCKLCSIYLCNSEALQRHYLNVHSQDYVCNVCGKRCKSRKALNNHQNVHSAAKFKCNLCSNVYKSSHILKEHLLKHEGIRKYKCNVCEKDFAQQSHLAAHMAVHSEKRFFCPGCKRAFNRHDNMKMHTKRCEPFLAKPELSTLLTIRRSRSKPSEALQNIPNRESSSGESDEAATNARDSEKPTTDGFFLKVELVKTESNSNTTSQGDS